MKSPNIRSIVPWRVLASAAGGLSVISTVLLSTVSANAETPQYPDIMPLSHVKEGMIGYGLTTFHGTTISRFNVKVIGIVKNTNVGRDLILIRMKGGPITERGANLIQGMSGSPIYINGKLIGAFSQGESFQKEPVGMVTPIEDMLDDWDPKIPQTPDYFKPADKPGSAPSKSTRPVSLFSNRPQAEQIANLVRPLQVGDRTITKLVLDAPLTDPLHSDAHQAVLHRATSFMTAGSLSERNRQWLQKELVRRGYAVTVVSGSSTSSAGASFQAAPLRPGSCFGTFLATGDSPFGGFGTITYRRKDRVLGFGHPLFQLGPLEAAITSAYVVDVLSGVQVSHFIAIPGKVVGTLRQDRDFAVAGEIGRMPRMLPFDITVNDATNHRMQTFHNQIFRHPDLTPMLLGAIIRDTVGRVHDVPGDVMAKVTTTLDAAEVGTVTRTNLYFDSTDVSSAVGQDMGEITNIISGNPFYPLPIKSAHMTVNIMPGHNTASVERIFLKQGRYEPGDTLEIGVVLKPYRRDPIIKTVSLKIPADTPTGRYQLAVRGGVVPQFRLGGIVLGGGSQDGPQSPPANVRQMVARLNEHETNTDIVARLVLNSVAPSLEGEKLSQLPPNIAALMRSDRNSGVRLEREEVRTVQPAGYVTSGVQQLVVTVVRKNTLEPSGASGTSTIPTGAAPSGPTITLPGGAGGQLSSSADDFSVIDQGALRGEVYERLFSDPKYHPWLAAVTAPPPRADSKGIQVPPTAKTAPDAAKTTTQQTPTVAAPQPAAQPVPPPDISNDKPVGRQMQVWRQAARTDFPAGKFTGTSVAANGVLRPAPTLQRIASTTETYIWSLAADEQGTLYAGTGTSGKILKITPDGKQTLLAALPIVSVQSLLYSPHDRALYAGSGVKGNLFRVNLDGTYRLVVKLPERYVLALIMDDRGDLYVGAGGGGSVYRIPADKLASLSGPASNADVPAIDHLTPFTKTAADHVLSLTLDHQDNLYVGTGNNGIVYKVTPDGKANVLFDAKENSITGLTTDKDGTVYAVTGPKGILYRISPDGGATTLFDRTSTFYTGIKAAPDGSLYATTVNSVLHFMPSDTDPNQPVVVPLDNPKDIDFLSLVVLADGSVAAGTGNIGEVYAVGARWSSGDSPGDRHKGQFVSTVHDAKLRSQWGMAYWEATVPAGSSVRVETRTGNAAEPDSTWSSWSPVSAQGRNEGPVSSPAARFIQYRITMDSTASAQPGVRGITIGYLPRNQPPRVAFQSPSGGERWSKSQTIRWNANDPDGDTLTYELFFSADGGATWKPLPLQSRAPGTPGVGPARPAGAQTFEEYQKQVNENKDLPDALKQSLLEGFRRRSALGGAGVPTRDTSKTWDTSSLPDGVYMLKVVASDHISNPTDPLTAQAISEPVLVVNALPKIALTGQPRVGTDRRVTVQGIVSQQLTAVTAVQVRVDGGDWIAAAPTDGLFDGPREPFSFATSVLSAGKHTIEVEAFNAAGQRATEKTEILVP